MAKFTPDTSPLTDTGWSKPPTNSFGMGGKLGGETPNRKHQTENAEVQGAPDRITVTEEFNADIGDYAEDIAKVGENGYIGQGGGVLEQVYADMSGAEVCLPVITDLSVRLTKGGRVAVTRRIVRIKKVQVWSLDFNEVSRPIIQWGQDAESGSSKPEVDKIRRWQTLCEKMGTGGDNGFKYTSDGDELEGTTRDLAEMIYKGIESFSVYVPVVTRTTNAAFLGDFSSLTNGELSHSTPKITVNDGFKDINPNENVLDTLNQLAKVWVKTADRVNQNQDGTFTRTEQWTGFTSVEEKLFSAYSAG